MPATSRETSSLAPGGMRQLSPRRKTTQAEDAKGLVAEQLAHFGIEPESPLGQPLARIALRMYECHADIESLWRTTLATIGTLDRSDRIAYFNGAKFLAFQLAKLLDML